MKFKCVLTLEFAQNREKTGKLLEDSGRRVWSTDRKKENKKSSTPGSSENFLGARSSKRIVS